MESLYLEIVSAGRSLPPAKLPNGKAILGRHPGCDVVVPDRHASRQQLLFTVEDDDHCRVKDIGDKNPVHLNGQPIKEADFSPSDRIDVGESSITLHWGVPAERGHDPSSVRFVPSEPSDVTARVTVDATTVTGLYADQAPADREGKLNAFYQLSEVLARAGDAEEVFGRVLDVLFAGTAAERGFIGLGNPDRGDFQVVRVRNDRGDQASSIDMSQTILDEIKLEKKAILVPHAPSDLAYTGSESIIRLGICSFMCAPMFLDDEFVGVIYLDHLGSHSPFEEEDLRYLQGVASLVGLAIDNLRVREQLDRENRKLKSILERKNQFVANSPVMVEVVEKVHRVADRDSSVLILGETGTGKEVVARAIHDQSERKDEPFVAFNCSTSSASLIESELFGHVKGAFTDASRDHKGKFELAHKGTLFLDEIGEMPLETQAKMLRVLQDRQVEPVGGEKSIPVDIRIVSATHQDLTRMRKEKTFRDDLFFRLAVLTLELPPLRDRGDDILAIAEAFLPDGMKLEKPAQKALLAYGWPGNVRELRNAMEQASFNAPGDRIRLQDLPADVAKEGRKARIQIPLGSLEEMEKKHIRRVLKSTGGNKTRAAEVLGISRETLYQKIKLYEL